MDFIKQCCVCCLSFCSLYRDVHIPVKILEDDTYILLKEVNINCQENNGKSKNAVERIAHEYGMKMLKNCRSDRII